jgi:hypothetical protein
MEQVGIMHIGSSCFPLCEQCWQELTPGQRLPYYRALVDSWMSDGRPNHNGIPWDELWTTIEKNVLAGQ